MRPTDTTRTILDSEPPNLEVREFDCQALPLLPCYLNLASSDSVATLSCIAGAVDIAYALHDRTNGATVSLMDGSMADKKLFSISIYPERTIEFRERPTREELFEFAKANLDLLLKPGHALGTWFNDWDLVHIVDVVICIPDRDVALELGRRFDQLAIFDLEARREIPISRASQESTAKLVEVGNV